MRLSGHQRRISVASLQPSKPKDKQILELTERCQKLEEQVETMADLVYAYNNFVTSIKSIKSGIFGSNDGYNYTLDIARKIEEAIKELEGE